MNCPICGSGDKKRMFKLCGNMKVMGADFPQSSAFIAKCNGCGLLHMDTEATQSDFLRYYQYSATAPRYYDMFGAKDTNDYYQHLFDILKPYLTAESHVLDIAGAWGEFAGFLKARGYENVTVLEPNEACATECRKRGVQVVVGNSSDMSYQGGGITDGSCDLVILNHTLEHVLDVEDAMREISRVLRDDGCLFIESPDVDGYADEDAAPFQFLTYEHVLHLSMRDLENLARRYGYEILESGRYYKKISGYPSIYAVLKKAPARLVVRSDEQERSMARYLKKSERRIEEFIQPLRQSGEPLILWGIGASTAILIERFEGCNVKALIDRNPNRQGLEFLINGSVFRVEAPERVRDGSIVILSIPYRRSIQKQIREMGFQNKITFLEKK